MKYTLLVQKDTEIVSSTRNSSKPFLGRKLRTQKMSHHLLIEHPVFGASGQLFGKRHDVMKVQHCLTARRPHPIAAIMGLDATLSGYALLQNSGFWSMQCQVTLRRYCILCNVFVSPHAAPAGPTNLWTDSVRIVCFAAFLYLSLSENGLAEYYISTAAAAPPPSTERRRAALCNT